MAPSVVVQAYADNGSGVGLTMISAGAAINHALQVRQISAAVEPFGSADALAWAKLQGCNIAAPGDAAQAQAVLRIFPAGLWPTRPVSPYVVDLCLLPSHQSGVADHTIALGRETGYVESSTLTMNSELYPIPEDVLAQQRAIATGLVVVHLGQDPNNRIAGIVNAIHGFSGLTAQGVLVPGYGTVQVTPPIFASGAPWVEMRAAQVIVASVGFAARFASGLRIPTLAVANNATEHSYASIVVSQGANPYDYLGLVTGLTNTDIRDEAKLLAIGTSTNLHDTDSADTRRRVLSLASRFEIGSGDGAARVAMWVARQLIGTGRRDPHSIKGYDTIRTQRPGPIA